MRGGPGLVRHEECRWPAEPGHENGGLDRAPRRAAAPGRGPGGSEKTHRGPENGEKAGRAEPRLLFGRSEAGRPQLTPLRSEVGVHPEESSSNPKSPVLEA